MPNIKTDWGRFVVYSNDHSPPHVHCKFGDGTEYRIDLRSGRFMGSEPSPPTKSKIMKSYQNEVDRILTLWENAHPVDR